MTDGSYFTGDVYNSVPTEIKFYWDMKAQSSGKESGKENDAAIGGHDWVLAMADPTALIPALGGAAPFGAGLLVLAGGSVAYVATRTRRRRSVAETSN